MSWWCLEKTESRNISEYHGIDICCGSNKGYGSGEAYTALESLYTMDFSKHLSFFQ